MSKRHVYRLDIATETGMTTDESVRCLRAMLKAMLRSYGVRCLCAVAVEPSDDGTSHHHSERSSHKTMNEPHNRSDALGERLGDHRAAEAPPGF